MRILYIHQFFATRESSLGLIRSYEFSRRWVEQGHEVTIITSDSRLPDEYSKRLFTEGAIDGIRIRSVRVGYDNRMGKAQRIASFLKFMFGATWLAATAGRHDVVLATSTPLTVGIPGWIAAAITGAPFVFEVRDLWPEAAIQMDVIGRTSLLGRAGKALERFLYRRSAEIVALSPGMVEGVLAEDIDPRHVHMVPNSSDLDLFSPGRKDAGMIADYDLGDRFVVGYAGAIGPSNAVEDNVPEAARILAERGRDDIVFAIVGAGKSLSMLEERVEGLGNVRLLGTMPKADVPRFTRTADALMVLFADKPILATNSPNKFFDGLASGRPMIVNSDGWTRELVESNDCGAYFPAGEGAALADIIERLADDRKLAKRQSENARHLAEKCFSRDLLARKVMEALESAVGPQGHTSSPEEDR